VSIAIGIDIGGTYSKLVAISPEGTILSRSRLPTNDCRVEQWRPEILAEVVKVERECGRVEIFGIACPGLVHRDGHSITWMKGRLNCLEGLDWAQALGRGTKVPVINDAHAALKAEAWLGAARGCRNVVMLTLGTGVGGAIMCDGRVLAGSMGRAGHLGHITVDLTGPKDIVNTPGSLEVAIGECTLPTRSEGRFTTTSELVTAHLQGDSDATEIWRTSVRSLAAALVSIINAVDSERILLGGGIARAGSALFEPLKSFMDEYEWRPYGHAVEIVPAELGDEAGAIGSAKHAMECYDAG
jgi:glucokinase